MMEIKILLAMLLQRFRLQCLSQTKIDRTGLIVMAPKYQMPMITHKQDGCVTQAIASIHGNVRDMVQPPS